MWFYSTQLTEWKSECRKTHRKAHRIAGIDAFDRVKIRNLGLRSKGSRVRVAPRAPIYGGKSKGAPTSGGVGVILSLFYSLTTASVYLLYTNYNGHSGEGNLIG